MSSLDTTLEPALEGCIDSCRQCISIAHKLTPGQFTLAPDGFSSTGAHLRHCVEHFEALLEGWPRRLANYDARRRDTLIEKDPAAFIERMERVIDLLRGLSGADMDSTMQTIQAPSVSSAGVPMSTTLERELVFLSSHCIHHLAIVRLTLAHGGIASPGGMGTAWSTSRWEAARRTGTTRAQK